MPDLGVRVRQGPFTAVATDRQLLGGESVLVIERVTAWRIDLVSSQGCVHDIDENGNDVIIAHSLRHRSRTSLRVRQAGSREEVAYSTIITRLFHSDAPADAYRRPRDLPSSCTL